MKKATLLPHSFVIIAFLFLSLTGWAQQRKVSGIVQESKNNSPLEGATVSVKDKKSSTMTGADGRFNITVPDGKVSLIVSFVGYETKEVSINGQTNLTITLQTSTTGLNEVVVVGYGKQKKIDLTGAVETVDMRGIGTRPLTNASAALQGKVAGAFISQNSGQPGHDDAQILIRGVGTFNNTSPLVIIDGMEGSLSNINPQDIASVSILKDAASSAIYGNRAANGVILITTREGSTGHMNIDYTGYYGVQGTTSMPKLLKGVEYLNLYAEALKNSNGSYPSWFTDTAYMNKFRNHVDENLYPTNYEPYDEIFKPARISNHYVNISGGTKQFKYSTSIGYLDQDGIVGGNNTKKLTFRTNLSTNFLNDKLRINLFTSGSDQITNDLVDGMNTAIYFAQVQSPLTRLYTPGYGYSYNGYDWGANAAGGYNRTRTSPINVRVAATYNLLKGLDLNTSYGIWKSSSTSGIFRPFVQLFGGIAQDGTIIYGTPNPTSLSYNNFESIQKIFNAYANYSKELLAGLQFSIMGGFETKEYTDQSISASRQNFSVNLPQLSIGDPNSQKNSGGGSEGAWESLFGRINFSYKDKYLLESNIRRDGSSRFLNKWGTFPSFSVGWRISEESFIKENFKQLSNLKFRASWGRLGNESIGQYYAASDVLSLNLANNFNNSLYPAAAITQLANKNTSWETSEQTNIGLDIGLFSNKITGVIDYFKKNTFNILMQIPVSSTLGLSSIPYQNVGAMQNQGIEIQIGYSAKIKDIKFKANVTLNHTTNKITSLHGQDQIIFGNTIWKVGQPYNSFYGYQTEGIYQSQEEINKQLVFTDNTGQSINPYAGLTPYPGDIRFKDQNGDHIIDSKDKVLIGKPFPDWTFSSAFDFDWRGFDLSLFLVGVSGVNSLNQFTITSPFYAGGATGVWYRDGWTSKNHSNTIQRVSSDPQRFGIVSDYYLENASYIRLKNIEIGYTIPNSDLLKLNIKNLRLFANVQNAFTLTKMRFGFDPEKPSSTTSTLQYPQTRIYSAGISLKF